MAEEIPAVTPEIDRVPEPAEKTQEKTQPINRVPSSSSNAPSSHPAAEPIASEKDVTSESRDRTSEGSSTAEEDNTEYPSAWRVALIMVAIYLSAFLVALDRTIVATAVPSITDEFRSLGDIGWYASAYMLTSCAFQLLIGKIYTFYSPKWIFIIQILLFNIGSALSGAAPSSTALIIGRAISGIGSAGTNAGVMIILAHIIAPSKRPMCTGLLGTAFGIAAILGPIIGGAFTTYVTWRWCFFVNLPCGLFTILVVLFLLKLPAMPHDHRAAKQHFDQFDIIGTVLFLPSIISLLLAMQWGGSTYAWNNWRIIGLFVVFGVLMTAFVAVQVWKKEDATVPPRIMKLRSISAGFLFSFCVGGSLMLLVYYLPIWFQVVKGESAASSGISNIPVLIALVVGSICVRGFITGVGYYAPFMIASSICMSIGSGLFTTFTVDTPSPKWIGYQVLYGFGVGLGLQQSTMAALTVVDKRDLPISMALMFFAQTFGGALFVSIGQNVFSNKLVANLSGIPGIDAAKILKTGVTKLRTTVDLKYLGEVLVAYNAALRMAFIVVLSISCISALAAIAMEWKSVKNKELPNKRFSSEA